MSTTVEQIKSRLSVTDVISLYVKLEKAGANYKARCPFHNEKTPSFFVSPARNSYYCFGCGAKGDIFTFVEEFEGLDFMGALKLLAARAGVSLEPENKQAKTERERLFQTIEAATIFFQRQLVDQKEALLYLKKRGLAIEMVKEWRLGFALNEWRALYDHLKEKGFTDGEIEKAGLAKKPDSGEEGVAPRSDHGYFPAEKFRDPASLASARSGPKMLANLASSRLYDRFRGRIIFPLFDTSGRVIAFSGRILVDDGKSAKYLNSPDTPLFDKSSFLYGFHKAKWEIRKRDFAVLVEGQMDLLMSQQAGFTNTVAVSGTALTENHLILLNRLSHKVILAFDADSAGFKAAERGAKAALALGMEVKMAKIAGDKDPADLILHDPKLWANAIENSVHIIDFVLDKILETNIDEREIGKEVRAKVLPFVSVLESSIEKSHFVSKISARAKIREEALWEDLKKINATVEKVATPLPPAKSHKDSRLKKLLGLIFWQEASKEKAEIPNLKAELETLIGPSKFNSLLEELKDQQSQLIFEAEVLYKGHGNIKGEAKELLYYVKEDVLKEKFAEAMQELVNAEREKDSAKAAELLQKCREIGDELSKHKKSFASL